jgi:hypothetical protein
MIRLRTWRSRIAILAAIAIAVYAVVLFVLIESSDAAIRRVVDQLQPGVADAEVRLLLGNVRYFKTKLPLGNDAYVFYGVDEFVYVVMEGSNGDTRIARLDHQHDVGPIWDRVRRSWERRTR